MSNLLNHFLSIWAGKSISLRTRLFIDKHFFLICGHFSNGWYYYRYQALQDASLFLRLSLFLFLLSSFSLSVSFIFLSCFCFHYLFVLFLSSFCSFHLSWIFLCLNISICSALITITIEWQTNRLRQMYNCKVLIRIIVIFQEKKKKIQSN